MSTTLSQASNSLIFHGQPMILRKCTYIGHATTVYSVEHAIQILDEIGASYKSDDVLPFAMRLVEGNELIQIGDDNGEFGASEILMSCVRKLDGFNILLAVSRKVSGCYVSEIVQPRKVPCIRNAAISALEMLKSHLLSSGEETKENDV